MRDIQRHIQYSDTGWVRLCAFTQLGCVVDHKGVRGVAAADEWMRQLDAYSESDILDPREFLIGFFRFLQGGGEIDLPDPLPPDLEQEVRILMVERLPWDKDPPMDELARTAFPKLVLSGGHHPAFDAVCEEISAQLDADHKVLAGNGHGVPGLVPTVNNVLALFFDEAQTS